MAAALANHCGDVVPIGPVRSRLPDALQAFDHRALRWSGRRYDHTHSVALALASARIIGRKISRERLDVLVAPAASTEIAFLRTRVPIIYLSDATFSLLTNYYPAFSNLLALSAWEGNLIERRAIRRARALVYATSWAARSAVSDYGAPAEWTHVAPFGANLDDPPSREEALAPRTSAQYRLLFLGVNWERKGGRIALDTLRQLERRGIAAELVVCGCAPPADVQHQRMTVIPFLDKGSVEDRRRLRALFLTSHVFFLPTRAECSGVAFCEAHAYGLPVVTTDTGGVSEVVTHGENGILLPPEAGGEDYAQVISELRRAPGRLMRLGKAGRAGFEERLNWDAWGMTMRGVIERTLDRAPA